MTETFPGAEAVVQPKAETSSFDPSVEATARQLLGAYFGPGGMMSQPIPIPMRQVAGLGSMDVMARNLAGGLGGFAPQLSIKLLSITSKVPWVITHTPRNLS